MQQKKTVGNEFQTLYLNYLKWIEQRHVRKNELYLFEYLVTMSF